MFLLTHKHTNKLYQTPLIYVNISLQKLVHFYFGGGAVFTRRECRNTCHFLWHFLTLEQPQITYFLLCVLLLSSSSTCLNLKLVYPSMRKFHNQLVSRNSLFRIKRVCKTEWKISYNSPVSIFWNACPCITNSQQRFLDNLMTISIFFRLQNLIHILCLSAVKWNRMANVGKLPCFSSKNGCSIEEKCIKKSHLYHEDGAVQGQRSHSFLIYSILSIFIPSSPVCSLCTNLCHPRPHIAPL